MVLVTPGVIRKINKRLTHAVSKSIRDGVSPIDAISLLCGFCVGVMMRDLDMSPEQIGVEMQTLARNILTSAKEAQESTH